MRDVNLFAGAGGLALGLRAAGFHPTLLYEKDKHAWATLKRNKLVKDEPPDWEIHRGDVRRVRWESIAGPVRLLAGGVPCQPFSLGGSHYAERDERDMFPEAAKAIHVLTPQAFFIENVFGLLRKSFRPYFEYILRRLECVSIQPLPDERWEEHNARIVSHQKSSGYQPDYLVSWKCVDAADYGVPQNRKRVFIVGTRADLPAYDFPPCTHDKGTLRDEQREGTYWKARDLPMPPELPWVGKGNGRKEGRKAWKTIYDAIHDLTTPAPDEASADMNHWAIPGARSYPGHSGSHLHWTSKTIKAGVHGVPGGENTLRVNASGRVRYYTLREAARIQTFPDDHYFEGARIHVTRQIGNAIPCDLVASLARPLRLLLEHEEEA